MALGPPGNEISEITDVFEANANANAGADAGEAALAGVPGAGR